MGSGSRAGCDAMETLESAEERESPSKSTISQTSSLGRGRMVDERVDAGFFGLGINVAASITAFCRSYRGRQRERGKGANRAGIIRGRT